MTDKHLPELMTVKEAADYLQVSKGTIRRWIKEKLIKAVRIGRDYRIQRNSFLDSMKK